MSDYYLDSDVLWCENPLNHEGYRISELGELHSRWKHEWYRAKRNPTTRRVLTNEWTELIAQSHDYTHYVYLGSTPYRIHRLVLLVFVGPCPAGCEACHKNDNKFDNVLTNLYWGTHFDNCVDRKTNGRQDDRRGHRTSRARLRDEQAIEMRLLHESGVTREELIQRFGVPSYTVRDILLRRSYKHV